MAKHAVLVGVPYKQDRRVSATHCVFCGRKNPCWGHVNDFDEARLKRLFEGLVPIKTSFVGQTKDRTNAASAYLMDKARNPWGTYEQEEACVHCGNQLIQPKAGLWLRRFAPGSLQSWILFSQCLFRGGLSGSTWCSKRPVQLTHLKPRLASSPEMWFGPLRAILPAKEHIMSSAQLGMSLLGRLAV